jgi:hypothetical protein
MAIFTTGRSRIAWNKRIAKAKGGYWMASREPKLKPKLWKNVELSLIALFS